MLPQNVTAIVARNEEWRGMSATEPYECGWAHEALVFVRALKAEGMPAGGIVRVQVSPDGMRWLDEGTTFPLPSVVDQQSFARVAHFGGLPSALWPTCRRAR